MESDVPEQSISEAKVSLPANPPPCKTAEVEDSDVSSTDEQDDSLPRPVRRKRPNRRYAEWSSDDEYCLRALKRSNIKYKEPESSSESESEFIRPARVRSPFPFPDLVDCCERCLRAVCVWRSGSLYGLLRRTASAGNILRSALSSFKLFLQIS